MSSEFTLLPMMVKNQYIYIYIYEIEKEKIIVIKGAIRERNK